MVSPITIGRSAGIGENFRGSGFFGTVPSGLKTRSVTTTGLYGVRRNGTWPSWSRSVSDERLKMRRATAVAPNWTTSFGADRCDSVIVRPLTITGLAPPDREAAASSDRRRRRSTAGGRDTVGSSRHDVVADPPTDLVTAGQEHERAPGLGARR